MSDKAVILVDDEIAANKIVKSTFNKKKARYKKYYLNWYLTLAKEVRENLVQRDFTLINSDEIAFVKERVELYLFGKVNVFSRPDLPPESTEKTLFKKGYFTHLEKADGKWRILVSSHETDDEINDILGKNWDTYLEKLLLDEISLNKLIETRLETDFHEMIYPHLVDGKLKKLSIVHVNTEGEYLENIMGIHSFLQKL